MDIEKETTQKRWNIDTKIEKDEYNTLTNLLNIYDDLFTGDISISKIGVYHEIDTGNNPPVCCPIRRYSPKEHNIIKEEIQKLLENNCIRPSVSKWQSPVVIVKFFSTLDLTSGYWQLPIASKDAEKTAFLTREGLYEWKRMPMGLMNAPFTFQKYMDHVFKGITCVRIYLDDIIIHSKTFDQHILDIQNILEILSTNGIKLKLSKCLFGYTKIQYLGHIVSGQGIEPDSSKIDSITTIDRCYNTKQVRSFLGLVGYYRKFIYNFSKIAAPLNNLLCSNTPFVWNSEIQMAFNELKSRLINSPILAYPDFSKPFVIQCDACKTGYGAILSQIGEDGKEHPISYYSRTTSPAERNYDSREAECSAVITSLKAFRPYIYGQEVTVFTDHQSLKYLQSSKDLTGKYLRWQMIMQDYNPIIIYKPGPKI